MAATSPTTILNDALMLIGEPPVDSIDNDIRRARLGKTAYDYNRDALLREHPWNFAVTRVTLSTASSTAPAWGYSKAFAVPADFRRFVRLEEATQGFAIEQHKGQTHILIDTTTVNLKYVADVTDANRFDMTFRRTLAAAIAMDLAIPLTRDKTLHQQMVVRFDESLAKGQFADSQEAPIQSLEPREWLDVRTLGEESHLTRGVEGVT